MIGHRAAQPTERTATISARCLILCCSLVSGLLWFVACTSSQTAATSHGRATLVVSVKAEPRQGWHDPAGQSTYAGLRPGERRDFETVDYAQLDEIVVCVEPANEAASPTVIYGPPWARSIQGGLDRDVVIRTEDGRVISLPRGTPLPADVSGCVELTTPSQAQPVALYIAPTRHATITQAGRRVTFDDLPPGPARVSSWHPRLPGSQAQVTLQAGRVSSCTLVVGVNALPKVP